MNRNRKYFVCSVGKPGEDYVEENLDRIIKNTGFVLHEYTKQKGVYEKIENQSILILKYNRLFIAYGEVISTEVSEDDDWNHWAFVNQWYFFNQENPKDGVDRYGIDDSTLGGGKYGTVKEVDPIFAFDKIKLINTNSDLFQKLNKEFEFSKNNSFMENILEILKANKNIILTGAPGTGKTYLAKELAKKLILTSIASSGDSQTYIEPFLNEQEDLEQINKIDEAWEYWKNRILSNDFNIDDFANTISNVANPDAIKNGFYLMNFLERTSSDVYGSSKPGNAFNYGIKMNSDKKTYIVFNNKEESVSKETAELIFNVKIKPWLQQLLRLSLSEKINLVESGNELIRAGQLLRKIVILEHPQELLSIYKDEVIDRAYSKIIGGAASGYFEKNISLINYLLDKHKLSKTVENQFHLTSYIWTYFNNESINESDSLENAMSDMYYKEHCEFVQFHPSFDYTDFVEGLRPIKKGDNELGFELKNGIFKQLCKKAVNDKTNSVYVIIIDEINRAEISKVFGELFFAIDPGYRGPKGKVKTQYANIQNEETCFITVDDPYFYVPDNVYIIGTMNDIDRSVESFDFAMRRRFTWVEIQPKERISMWDGQIDEFKALAAVKMNALNEIIKNNPELGDHFQIGPAYFLKLKEHQGDFSKLWDLNIAPLLKEYLRGTPDAQPAFDKMKATFNGAN